MHEKVMTIVDDLRDSQEAKEAVKVVYKISDQEKESLGKQIEKYQNYKATGDAEADKIAGDNLLLKFEDDARLTRDRYKKVHVEDPVNET
jgi:hypothetical protein